MVYYTYAYLREDGTPYYIGKGKDRRAYLTHNVNIPPLDRILFLKRNLTEEEAHKHEQYMISVLGRKDLGTGILRNLTSGGEGCSGRIIGEEQKQKISNKLMGHDVKDITRERMSMSTSRRFQNGNYIWVNDGTNQTMIDLDKEEIPEGFVRGRTTNNNMITHTEEIKQIISQRAKADWKANPKVWVNDGKVNRRVRIDSIPEGFVRGRTK